MSIAATSLVALVAFGRLAHAQSAEAEALFDAGDKLMTEGKLTEACESFDASNRAEPRAGTLIRLGECREKNHQLASAWSAYKDALNRVKDPNKRAIATEKVADLEPRLSHLTIAVGVEHREGLVVTRNGKAVDPAVWNRALPVDGGDYAMAATAPGFTAWSGTVTVPEERGDATAKIPALDAVPVVIEPVKPHPPEHPVEPVATFTPLRKFAAAVAVVGVASLLTATIVGASAKSQQHDAEKLCPSPTVPCADAAKANQLASSGHSRAAAANIAFGITAAAAIGAGVLWFVGRPAEHVTAVPVAGGATITYAGSF